MPKTTKSGTAKQSEIPSTLRRSPKKAQRTFAKAHDSALDEYGDERRANQVAWAAVKHSFEKVGDRWQPKKEKGPSDPRATKSTAQKRRGVGETFGGVDFYGHTKSELYERAKKLGVEGRSKMSKKELARAIARKQ